MILTAFHPKAFSIVLVDGLPGKNGSGSWAQTQPKQST